MFNNSTMKSFKCGNELCSDNGFMKCSGCHSVYYCNKTCQSIHWKNEHKTICKKKIDIKQEITSLTLSDSSNNSVNQNKISASSLPFPKDGIKLSSIKDFYDACGGKDKLIGLTTTDVNEKYQKIITSNSQLSYCEYLKLQNNPNVGQAVVFISHAWKYILLELIDALEWHFRDTPDIIIWFDMFSNNQHKAVDLDFDWWCNTFKSAIKDFGHTVMVFAPWNDPIPLVRGWCLWELYCTIITNAKFEVAMSKKHRDDFLQDICNNAQDSINKTLATINAEKSECFKKEDKDKIFKIVQDEVGFNKINSLVFERMRDWMIDTALISLHQEKDNEIKLKLMNGCGEIYYHQRNFEKAKSLYLECLEKRRQILGEDSPLTLQSLNNLAVLYSNTGQHNLAVPLFEECLKKSRLVPNSIDTLVTTSNLARAYESTDKQKSESLYVECIEKMKKMLGVDHPYTLATISNLVNLYVGMIVNHKFDKALYDKALYLAKECLEKQKKVLGQDHPETLHSATSLANLYFNSDQQSDKAKAQTLLVDCLEKRRKMLGVDHPHTIGSMNNLAILYEETGQYSLAVPLYEECLQIMGSDHPDTLKPLSKLEKIYYDMGLYSKALPLCKENLEKERQILGVDHPDTLKSMNKLSALYYNMGQYDKAQPLYEECLEKRRQVLGDENQYTLDTVSNLAVLYVEKDDNDKALPLLEESLVNRRKILGINHPDTQLSLKRLRKFLELTGKQSKVAV